MSNSDNGLRGHCDGCGQHITGMGEREGVMVDGVLLCDECAADHAERQEADMRAGQLDDEIDRLRNERRERKKDLTQRDK